MTENDRELTKLLEAKAQLEERIRNVERKIRRTGSGKEHRGATSAFVSRQRPVRVAALDALEDLAWPTYTRQITLYCQSRYGREIPSTRFGSLMADETRAHVGGRAQSVWLCYCLTYDRAEPIKRLLARSDWPLEQRLVAPTTGRIQHLKMTVRLAELALRGDAVDQTMLNIIAADHARDLPGVEVKRGEFELEKWRDVARRLLKEHEAKDLAARLEAAERLARQLRSPHHQLFGAPEVLDGHRVVPLAGRRA